MRDHLLLRAPGRRLGLLQALSCLVMYAGSFVVPWWVLQRTGSAAWSTAAAALATAGLVIGGVGISAWVDRRPLRYAAQRLGVLLLLASTASTLLLAAEPGRWALAPLLALQGASGVLAAGVTGIILRSAKFAYPETAIVAAGAAFSTVRQISWFAGQALAAAAVAQAGAPAAAGLAAGCALVSLLVLLRLPEYPVDPSAPAPAPRLRSDLAGLRRVPGFLPLNWLACAWNLLVGPLFASRVATLEQIGGLRPGQISVAFLLSAGGSAAALAVLHRMTAARWPERWLPWTLAAWSAAGSVYLLLAWQGGWLAALGWPLVMLVNTTFAGLSSGARTHLLPARLMALGMALTGATQSACLTAGGLLGGLGVARFGLLPTQAACLLLLLATVPAAWRLARRWRPQSG